MRRGARIPLLAASLFASLVFAQTPDRDSYIERFVGKPAPPLALKDVNGVPVKLSDYRGKVVLLNFWYSACPPCRKETPDLIALYQTHKDHGLVVLGINTDSLIMPEDGGSTLQRFLDAYRIPYPVLLGDRKVYEDYGRTPIAPITLLVDRQGTIADVFWGATRGKAFESAVLPYLEASAPETSRRDTGSSP
jgi:cytochrome c biogenesis protein CcmG, thiol:disulfide interchange protein DsbE